MFLRQRPDRLQAAAAPHNPGLGIDGSALRGQLEPRLVVELNYQDTVAVESRLILHFPRAVARVPRRLLPRTQCADLSGSIWKL